MLTHSNTPKEYFNSIKVRLKPNGVNVSDSTMRFQFHKGTIKTLPLLGLHPILINFNSIKVRLKRSTQNIVAAANSHFNSIKVRLKRRQLLQCLCAYAISIP